MRKVLWASLVTAGLAATLAPWPVAARAVGPCAEPHIFVDKAAHLVTLHCDGQLRWRATATFGAQPTGTKLSEGDERTPEGEYRVSCKRKSERFDRFLCVSYPNAADLQRAKRLGIANPGGAIGIHGAKKSLAGVARTWLRVSAALGLGWGPTDGCVGLANDDVESLYDAVAVGTPITIRP